MHLFHIDIIYLQQRHGVCDLWASNALNKFVLRQYILQPVRAACIYSEYVNAFTTNNNIVHILLHLCMCIYWK
jgi:hypothetical protein